MPGWSHEAVEEKLREKEWYSSERDIENGKQYTLTDGTRVNSYHTGKVNVQGKDTELKRAAKALFAEPGADAGGARHQAGTPPAPSRVFIVYGHDIEAREQLELFLRRLKLEPIVLQNIPGAGDTIIEKLEQLTNADYACVLVTPDDEGRKRESEEAHRPRARQNVVLELGMVLARLGRRRVAILMKGKDLERPSDIDGLLYLPFESRVDEVQNALAANLQEAGFTIQVKDLLG